MHRQYPATGRLLNGKSPHASCDSFPSFCYFFPANHKRRKPIRRYRALRSSPLARKIRRLCLFRFSSRRAAFLLRRFNDVQRWRSGGAHLQSALACWGFGPSQSGSKADQCANGRECRSQPKRGFKSSPRIVGIDRVDQKHPDNCNNLGTS